MRLKSLELCGFKSFPDKTVLDFGEGVTIVVGPNGSGKSNISDAVRWVLGEISSKNIRGTKMEDVIFGGTDDRRPMGFAEVTLVIDNSDDTGNPAKLASSYDEVSVTRRLSRSGDSTYMINKAPVRLKDITELFMNTGVGRSGYSIIGQGKIAEIISQKSDERRNIFEEASGIAKYRYQKNDAERKLREVDDNIIRANDIFTELDSRIGPLEKEAQKARVYTELYESKKKADISLWLYDIENVKAQLKEHEIATSAAKIALDSADEALNALESQNERVFIEAQDVKLAIEDANIKEKENREKLHELESTALVLENDILHLEGQKKKTAETILSLEANITTVAADKKIAEEKLGGIAALLRENEAEHEALVSEYNLLCALRDSAKENYSALTEKAQKLSEDLTSDKIKLSSLEGSANADGERLSSLEKDADSQRGALTLLEERITAADKSIAELESRISSQKNKISGLEQKASDIENAKYEINERENRLSLDISAKRQRADSLKRIEEHFEGYAQSVKAVMSAFDSGKLSGIYGPVSRLISVPAGFSTAIETALGQNLQNIVVENEDSAKAAIAYLKAAKAGRATFYPITSIKAQTLNVDTDSLKKYNGFKGIASDIIETDEIYNGIISYLLGRTVIADNLDNAAKIAKAFGYRFRIVTLDGQLINAGGSFTGGSLRTGSGILTRAAEIERFLADADKLEAEFKALELHSAELKSKADQLREQIRAENGKLSMMQTMHAAEDTQRKLLREQFTADKASLSELEGELSSVTRRIEGYESDKNELAEKSRRMDAEYSEINDKKTAFKLEIEKSESGAAERQIKINDLLLTHAELAKDEEAAKEALLRCTAALDDAGEKLSAEKSAAAETEARLEDCRTRIANSKADSKTLNEVLKATAAERDKLLSKNLSFEKQLAELRTKIKDKTHERENLFRNHTTLDAKKTSFLSEQDKMVERLWNDYELTYTSASELGYEKITAETRQKTASLLSELKSKLKQLGHVNINAIEEFKEVKERHDFLKAQLDDLAVSKKDLVDIIFGLERDMRIRFLETMEKINIAFGNIFKELFGGGTAELKLTAPDDALESGIEINVAPPGKIIKSLSLLSGGEQSFVAIALLFAILKVNPTPFCILDEIEAALDEVNVQRFADYIRKFAETTQFIVITHRRGTMEAADMLYGVTMPKRGISKVLSLDVNEAEKKLGVKL